MFNQNFISQAQILRNQTLDPARKNRLQKRKYKSAVQREPKPRKKSKLNRFTIYVKLRKRRKCVSSVVSCILLVLSAVVCIQKMTYYFICMF